MASLHALSTWYKELPQETKLKVFGIGSIVAFGGLYIRSYYKRKAIQQQQQLNNNNVIAANPPNNTASSIIIPLSFHKVFWGSYVLSSCSALLAFSTRFATICNQYIPKIMSHRFTKSLKDLLPPLPKTLSASFKLGQLESQLRSTSDPSQIKEILASASKILGKSVTEQQLKSILSQMISMENQQSTLQRFAGIFKFVNVMWAISIIGICTTVLPVVYYIGKPIWDEIYNFMKTFLTKLGEILKKILFNETAYTIYEIMGYFISWYCMYLGLETDGNSNIGFFTSLTGVGLWCTMLAGVSSYRHDHNRNMSFEVGSAMTAFFTSIMCGILGYKFKSTKIAFLSVGGMYYYLCSALYGSRATYHFIDSFFDGDMTGIGVTVSAIFNTGLIIAKWKNMNIKPFQPFISPLCIFGCVGLYSALLSYSWENGGFFYYRRRSTKSIDYLQRQYTMILSLMTGVGFGTTLNLPAMTNTAYTYSVFYVMQKMIEYEPFWNGINGYFTIFFSSIVTWRMALYLHKNPQIFTNMIKFE